MAAMRRELSAHAEVEAGDGFGDDIFLNLDQIAVGEGHAERSENIAAASDDDERAGPIVVIGFAATVFAAESSDCFVFSRPTTSSVDSFWVPIATIAFGNSVALSISCQLGALYMRKP